MELVPHEAIELRGRALSMMLVNLFAALLFGAAAVLFRHMAQKQEQLREQLNRDRELRTLGEMSAVLGHEIRNTIASLKGHAQLLAERDDAGKDTTGPRAILSDIDYLQGLSEQILDAAKAGSLRLERVYLDDLAEGAVALAGCDPVEVIVQGEPPFVMLDRRRMQQGLINLLRNARQAGADSPIQLRMHSERHRLTVEVVDQNGGIPEDVARRVFEPFFTTRARGTGLGLFIARRSVEAHGGTIRLDNRPGEGASFVIEIPCDRSETP